MFSLILTRNSRGNFSLREGVPSLALDNKKGKRTTTCHTDIAAFETIQDAIIAGNSKMTLTKNVTDATISIPAGQTIVINTNGYDFVANISSEGYTGNLSVSFNGDVVSIKNN